MAKLILANGTEKEITPMNGKKFTLDELYKAIGCDLVQVVKGNKGEILILDEEGKFKENPTINEKATIMYWENNYPNKMMGAMSGDYIVGNVVVCKSKEF